MAQSEKRITPRFRVAFPQVFQPKGIGNAEPKFSIAMLFSKADKSAKQFFVDLMDEALAKETAWDKATKEAVKRKMISERFGDGDLKPEYQGYAKHFYVNASNKYKPDVVDQKRVTIESMDKFYPGCYAHATIIAFTYNSPIGGKGISFSLQNIQKLADGERFGNVAKGEDDFDDVEVEDDEEENEEESYEEETRSKKSSKKSGKKGR